MKLGTPQHRRLFSTCFKSLIFVCLAFYFIYHSISGNKGLITMVQLEQKLAAHKQELAMVEQDRMQLERKVKGLYIQSLDLDLLDEQTRKVLGKVDPDEIVLFNELEHEVQ